MGIFNASTAMNIYNEATIAKAMYVGNTKVWPIITALPVTYCVDGSVSYVEEVEPGVDVLNPTTFVPSKDDWTIVGWREDKTASASVLTSKIMGESPITLYAVFHQDVSLHLRGNGLSDATDEMSETKQRYYNNGNVKNPTFTATQIEVSGWTSRGFTSSTDSNAAITLANGGTVTLEKDAYYIASYSKLVTVTYYDNSTTAKTKTGYAYTNYDWGSDVHPRFTMTQSSKTDDGTWTARGWAYDGAANATIRWSNGGTATVTENTTLYGCYSQGITATFYSGGTSDAVSGTRYYNSSGNKTNASVTAPNGRASNYGGETWTWRGWSGAGVTSSNATVAYANGATISGLTGNASFYGLYQIYRYIYYYNNSSTQTTKDGYDYYNDYGNVTRAQFNLTVSTTPTTAANGSWVVRGWIWDNTSPSAGVSFASGTTYNFYGNVNNGSKLYSAWSKSVSATAKSYNSTQTMSGTAYRDYKGTTTDATGKVPTGATYSGWTWRGWSASGATGASAAVTYANGASINLGTSGGFTIYGLYYQDVTLSYAAGGGSGSMSPQPATRYYNAYGSTHNPTLTLAANKFTRADYNFTGWDLGAVGASVTMNGNKTATAQWKVASLTVFSATVNVGTTSVTESNRSLNSTYISSIQNPLQLITDRGSSPEYTETWNGTLVYFTSAAASEFKTAEITYKYGYSISYGDLNFNVSGNTDENFAYGYGTKSNQSKTITISLSSASSVTCYCKLVNRYNGSNGGSWFQLGIQSIVLKA